MQNFSQKMSSITNIHYWKQNANMSVSFEKLTRNYNSLMADKLINHQTAFILENVFIFALEVIVVFQHFELLCHR